VKKKSKSMKSGRPTMSPLLLALTHSRAAREPMTNAMLLQSYSALDAFHRGHGSHALFMTLCRHLLVAEELCQLGYADEYSDDITLAHEALVRVEARHTSAGEWTLAEADHAPVCDALAIYAMQLDHASLEHIAQAEARMVTQSLVAARSRPEVERLELASSEH
jgi:hypothetical protein